jgi:hypothetical protein
VELSLPPGLPVGSKRLILCFCRLHSRPACLPLRAALPFSSYYPGPTRVNVITASLAALVWVLGRAVVATTAKMALSDA